MTVGDISQPAPRPPSGGTARGTLSALNPHRLIQRHRHALTLFFLILAFLLVLLWDFVVVPVRSGEQGVYWSRFWGGTSDMIIGEGTHFKLPWDDIIIYDVRVTERHQRVNLLTKDGLEIGVEWSVRYHPHRQTLPLLHRTLGPDYADKVVSPAVTSSLRQVLGNYRADEIYAYDEQSLLKEIHEVVRRAVETNMIVVDELLITRLDLPTEMSKGIVSKLLFEQSLLGYRFRVQEAEQERERKRIEAEGIKVFEQVSGISMLKWRGIEATTELAKSPNSKIILIGPDSKSLPLLFNADK